jgi:hypothetical protein
MTNTRKTPAPAATAAEAETTPTETAAAPETTAAAKTVLAKAAEETVTVVGPPLRPGQTPEKVTLAHHLRIGGKEYQPGQTAHVSPDYARQLRRNGYVARG